MSDDWDTVGGWRPEGVVAARAWESMKARAEQAEQERDEWKGRAEGAVRGALEDRETYEKRVLAAEARVASLEAQVERLKLELGTWKADASARSGAFDLQVQITDGLARDLVAAEAQVEVMRGALAKAVEHLVGEKTPETSPLGNRMQAAYAVLDNALSPDAHKAAKVNSDGEERCGCGFPHSTETEDSLDALKRLLDRLRLAEAVVDAARAGREIWRLDIEGFERDAQRRAGDDTIGCHKSRRTLNALDETLAAYDKQGDDEQVGGA